MIGQTFLYTTYHFIPFVSCMHASYAHQDIKSNTFSQICFLGISMGDRLEAWINAIKNIQEEFEHDIREMKGHLARVISLFEDHIKTHMVHSRRSITRANSACLPFESSIMWSTYEQCE